MVSINDGAGSVGALTGQENAVAENSAPLLNSSEHQAPDTTQPNLPTSEAAMGQDRAPAGEQALPIDAVDLLDRADTFYRRFVLLPSDAAYTAVILWAAHTHLMSAWDTTPRLAFLSSDPGSGKSRAMEITALLVPLALESANASTASIIRAINIPEGTPTFFIDEIDAKYGPAAKGDEDLRAMINAGHRRGGDFLRCEPVKNGAWVPVRLQAYAAIAMAGLGDLPDTILTRSVIIRMRKRAPNEKVEPYRQRDHKQLGHALRDELALWAKSIIGVAEALRPDLPDGIADRNADVWEPLVAVADLVGGSWPSKARQAATDLTTAAKSRTPLSPSIQLLGDIRRCFEREDRLTTAELLNRLLADEESLWGDFKGKKLDARRLGDLLRPYGIRSTSIRLKDGSTPKGYKREAFHDTWFRYLPAEGDTSATAATDTEILRPPP